MRILSIQQKEEYYQALLVRNVDFDKVFYVGVKTTGIFCRATCSAKKPKFKNCEFFNSIEEVLLASFRPCKICLPLSNQLSKSQDIKKIVDAVESIPSKRWGNQDFNNLLNIDTSSICRQFQKKFGLTFVEYARARRIGLAMKSIRMSNTSSKYDSTQDIFACIMKPVRIKIGNVKSLKASWVETQLGPMLAIADEHELYLLEFVDRRGLEREIERLRKRTGSIISTGESPIFEQLKSELNSYFSGKLSKFSIPLHLIGSDFQKSVWNELLKLPMGETTTYLELAFKIGAGTSYGAVGNANGANQIAIIIPCHRVINTNGELGGYGGGLVRKKWLLEHEENYALRA